MSTPSPAAASPIANPVPWVLILINLVGIALGYAFTMILARQLTHRGFEQYITAIATLGILASVGEAGFGKYALRIIPVYQTTGHPNRVRAYVRYAMVATLCFSLAVAVIAAGIEWILRAGEEESVILVAIATMPFLALTGLVVDLLLAFGCATSGMIVGRILVPATSLMAIGIGMNVGAATPLLAVCCFSAGSVLGLVAGLILCVRCTPPKRRGQGDAAVRDWLPWTTASISFMGFYALLSWLSRSPLFIASHLPYQEDQLAVLAPAFETGCLILLISKSTDKYFQPSVSRYLEATKWRQMEAMRQSRAWIIGSCVALFLVIVTLGGQPILRMYGEGFAAGYEALLIIAVGSSIWTLFSLSPSILLYAGGQRILVALMGIHAVLMVALMAALFPAYGAIGGATAYSLTVTSFALVNRFFAASRLKRLSLTASAAACGPSGSK